MYDYRERVMQLIFKRRQPEADNAVSFYFTPPSGFTWQAGQYLQWIMPSLSPDNNQNEHWFTISTAPFEQEVCITTRLSNSPFKQALAALQPGAALETNEPSGDFVWQATEQPKLFIAGGIGITPIRSILWQRNQEGLPIDAALLYFNRTPNYVFKDELDTINGLQNYFLSGPVSLEAISAADPQFSQKFIYLSGPEAMVDSVGQQLTAAGVPLSQIKQDWFPGYDPQTF